MVRADSISRLAPLLLAAALCGGCASSRLNSARENFYLGRLESAEQNLSKMRDDDTNRVLLLMERGSIRQALGYYNASSSDWIEATETARRLDYLSVSRGTASLAINDRVLAFRGAPYERTLVHAFTALNYIAQALWDDAAVEARNIVANQEHRNGFPDDPFSRYMAGFCFEMIADSEGARMQYEKADEQLPNLRVDPASGRIAIRDAAPAAKGRTELVCFVGIGRGPMEHGTWPRNYAWGSHPYAELYTEGRYLGRTHTLTHTGRLMAETEKKRAALRAARTATRIALKELAAEAVEEHNQLLGELLRLSLFALEAYGERRWETLPLWLQVGRVDCPPDLEAFELVFKNESGQVMCRQTVSGPLSRRGGTFASFARAF